MSILKKYLTLHILFLAVGFFTFGQGPGWAAPGNIPPVNTSNEDFAPQEIIVKLKPGKTIQSLGSLKQSFKISSSNKVFNEKSLKGTKKLLAAGPLNNIYIMKSSQEKDVPSMVREFKKNPNVAYAQPNYLYNISVFPAEPPNDTLYPQLYALQENKMDCLPAWQRNQGDDIIVAVIDTGVDYEHPDIAENMWSDETGKHGYDFVNGDADPMDDHGHGTHCAGTIAAVGNNTLGVIGVAPKAKIMAVKGLSESGSGSTINLANCITWAVTHGAQVLSNSWGGPGEDQLLADTINAARANGCVVVVAAGNDNVDAAQHNPANIPAAITVAATDSNDQKAIFSNWGNMIDVAAPGVDILSLQAHGTYIKHSGTSMACPHVAGLAALIFASDPYITNAEVEERIIAGADDIGPSLYFGHGRVNAAASVSDPNNPFVYLKSYEISDPQGNANGLPDPGEHISCSLILTNIGTQASNVSVSLTPDDGNIEQIVPAVMSYGDLATGDVIPGSIPFSIQINPSAPRGQNIVMTATITAENGYQRVKKIMINIPDFHLSLTNMRIDDSTGNANGTLDPGETADFVVELHNDSFLAISGVNTVISSNDPRLTILQNTAVYGNMAAGDIKENLTQKFTVQAGTDIPRGEKIPVHLEITTTSDDYGESLDQMIKIFMPFQNGWPCQIDAPQDQYVTGPAVVEDLDNDGNDEIMVSSLNSASTLSAQGRVHVYDHEGNILPGWPKNMVATTVSAADLDSNGSKELIIQEAGAQPKLHIFSANGNPWSMSGGSSPWPKLLFTPPSNIYSYPNYNAAPLIADIDNDGQEEIITVLNESVGIKIYAFNLNGTPVNGYAPRLLPKPDLSNPYQNYMAYSSPVMFDVDDDGKDELVLRINLYQGRPEVLRKTILCALKGNGQEVTTFNRTTNDINSYTGLAAGDLDNDDHMELVSAEQGNILVFRAPGTWSTLEVSQQDISGNPALGDLDNDGDLEILVTDYVKVHALHHTGEIMPGWPQRFLDSGLVYISGFRSTLTIADIDGDTNPEVFMPGHTSEEKDVFFNGEPGGPVLKGWHANGSTAAGFPLNIAPSDLYVKNQLYGIAAIKDLDSDNKPEIVYCSIKGKIYVWEIESGANGDQQPWPQYYRNSRHDATLPQPTGSPVIPAIPENLQALVVNPAGTAIRLTWENTSDNETGFILERSADDQNNFIEVASVPMNTTTCINDPATSSPTATVLYYRIRAYNGTGSSVSSVITINNPKPVPAAPSNLSAEMIAPNIVRFTWSDNASNENGFYLQAGPNWGIRKALSQNTTTTDLQINSSGTFRVVAKNKNGCSAPSNTITVNINSMPPTFSVSGTVLTTNGTPLPGVAITSNSTTIISTDNMGHYSFSKPAGWNGTIIPVKEGLTFTPGQQVIPALSGDVTFNFTGNLPSFTVSGTVLTPEGTPLPGVAITYNGTTLISTDASGHYAFSKPANWNGTIVPVKEGLLFTPGQSVIPALLSDLTRDFTGNVLSFTVSGTVLTPEGTPLPGVAITHNGSTLISTNASGQYTFSKSANWSGTVVPVKEGLSFTPGQWVIPALSGDLTLNAQGNIISLTVTARAVTPNGLPILNATINGQAVDIDGRCTFTVNYGANLSLVPLSPTHIFSPMSIELNNITENQNVNLTGNTQGGPGPNAPSNLSGTVISPTKVRLTWNDNSTTEIGFKIQRWNGNSWSVPVALGGNATTWDLTTAANQTHRLRIMAWNRTGATFSNEIVISTGNN